MLGFVRTRPKLILLAAAFAVLAAAPALAAQSLDTSNPDSVALHEKAKEAQARFERFREERIPPELAGYGGGCDEIIGRFCLRFEDGEDERRMDRTRGARGIRHGTGPDPSGTRRGPRRDSLAIPGFWASVFSTWERWVIGEARRT